MKYIAWVNYGYEGWNKTEYDTLEEAIKHDSYGSEKVITSGPIEWTATARCLCGQVPCPICKGKLP